MTTKTLTLWAESRGQVSTRPCFMTEATSQAFSVEIDSSKTVNTLKTLIKPEISDTFNGVDAKDLLVVPANKHKSVVLIEIDFQQSLTRQTTSLMSLKTHHPRKRFTSSSSALLQSMHLSLLELQLPSLALFRMVLVQAPFSLTSSKHKWTS
ncbi:hypothetical protein EC957_000844 [Mortierella hygrophila]|uniref:Crinkler effector protein N-terminal domain-containing protein n=1 Tax=Mortierella hygrophila TaxID=979708 RepID=A0A9P6F7E5_9FUNG|nr:hypothetical protein EC957_000844 [Mortierella hygrophila]